MPQTIISATGRPADFVGSDGDFVLDVAGKALYGPKENGVWPNARALEGPQGEPGPKGDPGVPGNAGATGPAGPAGTSGSAIRSVTGNPTPSVGFDGDYAIDSAAGLLYGPKAAGAWPAGVSLKGPKGDQGEPGPQNLLVLGLNESVPANTPVGTVILRRAN